MKEVHVARWYNKRESFHQCERALGRLCIKVGGLLPHKYQESCVSSLILTLFRNLLKFFKIHSSKN